LSAHGDAGIGDAGTILRRSLSTIREVPLECPRRVQGTPLHTGASAVFSCLARPRGVRWRHPPATRWFRSAALRSPKPRSNTGWAWRPRAARAPRPLPSTPAVPVPPSYTAWHLLPEIDRAEAGQGPGCPDRSVAQDAVRNAVQVAERPRCLVLDLIGVGHRRRLFTGGQGQRQGSQEGIRKNQDPAVPQARRNSRNSSRTSGQTVSDLLLRVKLNMPLAENPEEGRGGQRHPHQGRDRQVLQRKTSRATERRKKRSVEIVLTRPKRRQERQEGSRIGQELCQRGQEQVDRPDEQGQRRPAAWK